ncbi:MAG: tetratricopeptide repeat protein [Bacteroidetes bacterium]|nr:tetratricopeptide repeat protein [Bacteroidota bacterium]
MISKKIIFCFLFSLLTIILLAKEKYQIASKDTTVIRLLKELEKAEEDTNKITLLKDLGLNLLRSNPEDSKKIAAETLKLSEKLNYDRGVAASYNILALYEEQNGNYSKTIEYYLKALKIIEQNGDKENIANLFHNIGNTYKFLEDNKLSIEYLNKAMNLYTEINNLYGVINCYNSLGILYGIMGDSEQSLNYHKKGLEQSKILGDSRLIAVSSLSFANALDYEENFELIIQSFNEALNSFTNIGDKKGEAIVLNNLGAAYLEVGNFRFGDYKKAYEILSIYSNLDNELLDKTKVEKIAELEKKYQLEKKEQEIALQKKNIEVLEKDKKLKNYTLFGLIGFIILLIISSYLWFRNYKFKKNIQENEIRHQLDVYIKKIELLNYKKEQTSVMDTIKENLNANLNNPLSERELEVLEELSKGKTNKEIGETLFVSVNTIRTHLNKIYEKLDVSNRTQAVKKANDIENRPNG